jgi:hypothetical protein
LREQQKQQQGRSINVLLARVARHLARESNIDCSDLGLEDDEFESYHAPDDQQIKAAPGRDSTSTPSSDCDSPADCAATETDPVPETNPGTVPEIEAVAIAPDLPRESTTHPSRESTTHPRELTIHASRLSPGIVQAAGDAVHGGAPSDGGGPARTSHQRDAAAGRSSPTVARQISLRTWM